MASIKGAEKLTDKDYIIYGNTGVWLTNDSLNRFIDLNQGFPSGIDNRKIEKILLTTKGDLLAGTLFGLYKYSGGNWEKLNLPDPDTRITDLSECDGNIYILTRSNIIKSNNLTEFEIIALPAPENANEKVSLFRTLWTLHSGELFGLWGKIIVDLLALVLIFLTITGLLHWLFPKWIKFRKKRKNGIESHKKAMIKNLLLHNKVGYITVILLLITVLTGVFLRPPLLIAIATAKVKKIPFTILDNPNFWNDKLRRIIQKSNNDFIISTSDGFFYFDKTLTKRPVQFTFQPPVSIMGCTVLEFHPVKENTLLTGSFSGFFEWDLTTGNIINAVTNEPYLDNKKVSSPLSPNLVSGYIKTSSVEYLYDYRHGLDKLQGNHIPSAMPEKILKSSPISLWNVALEIHTGRIFEHLTGPFYILYIPLTGLLLILILVSGTIVWWKVFKGKRVLNNSSLTK